MKTTLIVHSLPRHMPSHNATLSSTALDEHWFEELWLSDRVGRNLAQGGKNLNLKAQFGMSGVVEGTIL